MDKNIYHVLRALCDAADSETSHRIAGMAKRGEWSSLQSVKLNPGDYEDAELYWRDAMCVDLLRKARIPANKSKLRKAAEQEFLLREQQCAATNARLRRYSSSHLFIETQEDERIYRTILSMRKDISTLLGPLPEDLVPRFSKGANLSDRDKLTTIPDKMSSLPTYYSRSRYLLPMWEQSAWGRLHVATEPVKTDSNLFFTVPKDGLKDRGCCMESSINITLQLAVGSHLKDLLKRRWGYDLRYGKESHMYAAQWASRTGSHATIDLSSASDTVSYRLVELLLPRQWFELLDSLRAPATSVSGKRHYLQKFSSMGNGFTFELETLIFGAICRVVQRELGAEEDDTLVFGDDIIVPTRAARSVLALLRFFGFSPNERKTFLSGAFRESCGGDFFNGVPVRAAFIEELPDEPAKWISLANSLRRVAYADGGPASRRDFIRRAWLRCLDNIPGDIRRLRGPVHLEDIVIHDEPERWAMVPQHLHPKAKTFGDHTVSTAGWDQAFIYAWCPVPKVLPFHHWKSSVVLVCAILGLPSSGVTPRGGVSGYRVRKIPLLGLSSSLIE